MYKISLEGLKYQSNFEPGSAAKIRQYEKACEALADELNEKMKQRQRLTIRAPKGGVIMPPPSNPGHESPDEQLPNWTGTPLMERNIGAFLQAKPPVLFCQIGDPAKMEGHPGHRSGRG